MRCFVFSFFLSVVVSGEAKKNAENRESEKNQAPQAYLAIIAIGAIPETRYEGDSLALRHPDEEPPPFLIFTKENKEKIRLRLGLNKKGKFQQVPAEQELNLKRKISPQSAKEKPYIKLKPLQANSRNLLILTPEGKGAKMWQGTPKINRLTIPQSNLKANNLLLCNFSKTSLNMSLGKKQFNLPPNQKQFVSFQQKTKKEQQEQKKTIQYQNLFISSVKHSDKNSIHTAVSLRTDQFNVLAFYQANPKTNRGKKIGMVKASMKNPSNAASRSQDLNNENPLSP